MGNLIVLDKLALARAFIKSKRLSKDGKNEFSKYNYYTPEYVDSLVTEACNEANLICVFNLCADQHGYYGEVTTYELETGESLVTIIRTEKPNITATNATQQMGGMNTYTKRYALMSLFCIEDNTIDFDAQDNRQDQAPKAEDNRKWLNKFKMDKVTLTDEWIKAVEVLKNKSFTLAQIEAKYKVNKDLKKELEAI